MDTRPTPTGFQHYLDCLVSGEPPERLSDPVAALSDLADGLTQPIVEVLERSAKGVLVRLSVFSEGGEASAAEAAAIYGLRAELVFSTRSWD
jgi:hypothetical protein